MPRPKRIPDNERDTSSSLITSLNRCRRETIVAPRPGRTAKKNGGVATLRWAPLKSGKKYFPLGPWYFIARIIISDITVVTRPPTSLLRRVSVSVSSFYIPRFLPRVSFLPVFNGRFSSSRLVCGFLRSHLHSTAFRSSRLTAASMARVAALGALAVFRRPGGKSSLACLGFCLIVVS